MMNFQRPKILGIVNITEDSFSDGGKYIDTQAAIQHARDLWQAGADIIDLGAAASSPIAQKIDCHSEIARLAPVVETLHNEEIVVSIDTFNPDTQQWAIENKCQFINDVSGFHHPSLHSLLARSDAQLIIMHSIHDDPIATPCVSDPTTIIDKVCNFFEHKLTELSRAGICKERCILDPGMGFFLGSNAQVSLTVLQQLQTLKKRFALPLFVSVSRKSFLRNIVQKDALATQGATLAAELYACLAGVDYIRTHDVAALADALTVWQSLFKV